MSQQSGIKKQNSKIQWNKLRQTNWSAPFEYLSRGDSAIHCVLRICEKVFRIRKQYSNQLRASNIVNCYLEWWWWCLLYAIILLLKLTSLGFDHVATFIVWTAKQYRWHNTNETIRLHTHTTLNANWVWHRNWAQTAPTISFNNNKNKSLKWQ